MVFSFENDSSEKDWHSLRGFQKSVAVGKSKFAALKLSQHEVQQLQRNVITNLSCEYSHINLAYNNNN
jgi:hypothetical protein